MGGGGGRGSDTMARSTVDEIPYLLVLSRVITLTGTPDLEAQRHEAHEVRFAWVAVHAQSTREVELPSPIRDLE